MAPILEPKITKNEAEFQAEFRERFFYIIFGLLEASGVDFDSILEPFLNNSELRCDYGGELWKERLAEPKKSENYE